METYGTVTTFTIGDRTYELVPFLRENERWVKGDTMVERAKELNANLGEEDGQFILKHQTETPVEFRSRFYLVFPAWHSPSGPRHVACLICDGARSYRNFGGLDGDWSRDSRLVRRIS